MKAHLSQTKVATEDEINEIDKKALATVEEAARFADDSPFPDPEELTTDVYISYP